MFHLGQQVVCIVDWVLTPSHVWYAALSGGIPIKGMVYTIRGIRPYNNEVGLYLEEIHNPVVDLTNVDTGEEESGEVSFLARGFRPVKKTDISILLKQLEPA